MDWKRLVSLVYLNRSKLIVSTIYLLFILSQKTSLIVLFRLSIIGSLALSSVTQCIFSSVTQCTLSSLTQCIFSFMSSLSISLHSRLSQTTSSPSPLPGPCLGSTLSHEVLFPLAAVEVWDPLALILFFPDIIFFSDLEDLDFAIHLTFR